MTTWQDVISDFKAEKAEYDGAAATLVLMYLAVTGKDYAYNMAQKFEKGITNENGWNEERKKYLRKLNDRNQLNILLPKMEKSGLLKSEKMDSGRKNRYYYINPRIFIEGPDATSCGFDLAIFTSRGKSPCSKSPIIREDRLQLAEEFRNAQRYSDLEPFFKRWSSIKIFNFSTFQQFLKSQAKRTCWKTIVGILEENIESNYRQQKRLAEIEVDNKLKQTWNVENFNP